MNALGATAGPSRGHRFVYRGRWGWAPEAQQEGPSRARKARRARKAHFFISVDDCRPFESVCGRARSAAGFGDPSPAHQCLDCLQFVRLLEAHGFTPRALVALAAE